MDLFKRPLFLIFGLLILLATSCSTPLTELIYLNGIEPGTTYSNGPLPNTYQIRSNDQLFIQVISDDPLNAAFLNLTGTQGVMSGGSSNLELITFLVDEQGKIEYPGLGQIQVGGLTIEEVNQEIEGKVNNYLKRSKFSLEYKSKVIDFLKISAI